MLFAWTPQTLLPSWWLWNAGRCRPRMQLSLLQGPQNTTPFLTLNFFSISLEWGMCAHPNVVRQHLSSTSTSVNNWWRMVESKMQQSIPSLYCSVYNMDIVGKLKWQANCNIQPLLPSKSTIRDVRRQGSRKSGRRQSWVFAGNPLSFEASPVHVSQKNKQSTYLPSSPLNFLLTSKTTFIH